MYYREQAEAEQLAREQAQRDGDIQLPRFLEYEKSVKFDKYGNVNDKWKGQYKYRLVFHLKHTLKFGYEIKGIIWKNTTIISRINTFEFSRKNS